MADGVLGPRIDGRRADRARRLRARARDKATLASFIGSREVEDDRADRFPTLELLRRTVPAAAIKISTNDIEAHLRLVEAGLGVSVLPRFVVAAALADRTLRDVLPRERLEFPLLLVTRKRRVLSRASQAFVDAVIASASAP